TSLSTFQASTTHRRALLDYQQQFYQQANELASKDEINGYVVARGKDNYRFQAFVDLLKQHQIEVKYLSKIKEVENTEYQQGDLYIPLAQPQYRLI
ncbi:peptidase M14, partial [Pseudoalteromonas phenolica]